MLGRIKEGVVDPVDEGGVQPLAWHAYDDPFDPALEVGPQGRLVLEPARCFQDDIHLGLGPGDTRRLWFAKEHNLLAADDDGIVGVADLLLERTVDRVVGQKVGAGLGVGAGVDGRHLHAPPVVSRLPHHLPADPAEAVEANSEHNLSCFFRN